MRPRHSLRYRIAVVIFLLEACMLAVVLSVTLSQSRATADRFNRASQDASLDLLGKLSDVALLTSEYADYQSYIEDVQKQPTIDRIVLADARDTVVAATSVEDLGKPLSEIPRDAAQGWKNREIKTAAGDLGVLSVKFSGAALAAAYSKTRATAIALALAGMGVIALFGLAAGVALTRRLRRVADAASSFAAGDLGARTGIAGNDEIADLAANVDRMADAVVQQQEQLKQQAEYIELLLASTAEAIFGVDTEGVCTFVNSACLNMLGYKHKEQLLGKNIHELIHHTYPDGRPYPREECSLRAATLRGEPMHSDSEVHWRADGSSFPVEIWSHPMYRDGQLIGAVVTFVDISARKQVEAELKRSNEELERRVAERTAELKTSNEDLETFAYSVSHDLRAPLRAIDGFCRLLEMDHSERLDGEATRYLSQVRRASQRMSRLIEDLLQMSSAARVSLTIMSVDLSAVARNIISQLQVADKDRQVSVVIEEGLRARCDPQLVTLLLENLLGNAWKFTRRTPDARIRFGSEVVLGETVFYVRDNGAGFDMEFAHKLFAPFQRLHSPDEFEGTGIGLASVARVASRHKGRAWGEGKPGEGAVFYFTLPSPPSGA